MRQYIALMHKDAGGDYGADDATALAFAANVNALVGNFDTALRAIERALALHPSCAVARFFGAQLHSINGNTTTATNLANRALRLSPFDRWSWAAYQALGYVAIQEGRFDDASARLAEGVQANPTLASTRFVYALTTALAGRVEEARSILRDVLELEPNIGIRLLKELRGVSPALAQRYSEGARILGLAEQ